MSKDKIPSNLEEAIELLIEYNNKCLDEIKSMTEKKFLGLAHHGMGRLIRNEWGLWFDETPISKWFTDNHNINHGDDRGGIILTSFYRKVKGEEINLEQQKQVYFNHWKKNGFEDGIFKP